MENEKLDNLKISTFITHKNKDLGIILKITYAVIKVNLQVEFKFPHTKFITYIQQWKYNRVLVTWLLMFKNPKEYGLYVSLKTLPTLFICTQAKCKKKLWSSYQYLFANLLCTPCYTPSFFSIKKSVYHCLQFLHIQKVLLNAIFIYISNF